MKLFFQTIRWNQAVFGLTERLLAYVPLLLIALMTVALNACQDDDMLSTLQLESNGGTTRAETTNTSGLTVQNNSTYGYVYAPSCRVPLVGKGRVINSITKSLVGVISSENKLENLVDENLTNTVSFEGVANVNLAEPLLSVRDVNRVYYDEKGIKVGFIYENEGGLLELGVLSGFWVKTYLNGVEQESSKVEKDGGSFNLVNLNLLNVAGGLSEISFTTKKPFDEVRIGHASIDVTALGGLKFYYAFVGENPKKIAAEGHFYNNADQEKPIASNSLVDNDLENGPVCGLVGGLFGGLTCKVNFKENIPVGSEVGYYASGGGVASIGIGATELNAYSSSDSQLQTINTETGIGVGVATGGKREFSMILTAENARKLELDLPTSINILSAVRVHYAYSRDPVKVDISSYFTIGNDITSANQYMLPPTEINGGTVTYTLSSQPSGANATIEGNKISGMNVDGGYHVMAVYKRGDSESIIQYAIITRKTEQIAEGCNNMMINTGDVTGRYAAVPTKQSGGSLVEIFNSSHSAANLVDGNPDNYAECISTLNLIQAKGLVAITSTEKISPSGSSGKTRVGFVMQTNNTLLSADVLKFFFVRLYDGEKEVYNGISQTNNTVDVGLIGGNGSKLRYYVETDQTFDRVELWTAGLLNLNLNKFRIYYAFYEPTTCESNTSTSEVCMELITAQKHAAEINYSETGSSSIASVGSTIENLSYVLDNSMETKARIVKVVDVIGRTTIAIKFNEIGGGQPVGAIISSPAFVANIGLLSQISVSAYNKGNVVADNTTSGGLASVEVIGDEGLSTIEVTPQSPFDEVRITIPSLAEVAEVVNVYGFYTRPDLNNNGIPDCSEVPEDQNSVKVVDWTKHTCVNNNNTLLGTVEIKLSGVETGSNYSAHLICYPFNGIGETVEVDAPSTQADSNGEAVLNIQLPVGDYSISGLPYNGIHVQVHSLKTTWKKNPADTDWNNWNNWTNGSPWHCTNVVIPTGATQYPKLTAWSAVNEFWGGNYCSYIHFEPDAAVLNTHYLQYEGAYVEKLLKGGNYYNVSMPLHGMVTGDMFISPEMPAYFTPLTPESYPEVRHNPVVRQRMWSKTVPYAISSSEGGTWAAVAEWSRTFNAVNQAYDRAQGFSMKVGDDSDLGISYRLRFPKDYDTYHYFTLGGVQTGGDVNIRRDMVGRFVYEAYTGYDPRNGSGTVFNYSLKNENIESTEFVAGNPFMSYLDIRTLLSENAGTVSAIRLETDNGNTTYKIESGKLIATGGENPVNVIAPMQAFYVTASASGKTPSISYSEKMFVQPSSTVATRNSMTAMQSQPTAMNISLRSVDEQSGCIVLLNNKASDAYVPGEDVPLLIDRERMPKLKVFTLAESKALDIQQMNDSREIELGFIAKGSQKGIMTLTAGSLWRDWCLVDVRTQTRYPLSGGSVDIKISNISGCNGRYYLVKQ
ncbi:hypothetical protein H6A37_12325 [Phocaeicola plebeius]|uniref:hypothetical protein n=1 Tax=Phocaeicola plebeius TaxID=310297 RepID=UPI0019564270|nr:hypothetical protein [Phocaeicola plebeius]MBM6964593.1 hypothetical protein [Phocaeicola plebeius]